MATRFFDGFYLGVFSDMDPHENNFRAENADDMLGMVVGSESNPLVDSLTSIGLSDDNGDNRTSENDNGQTAEDVVHDGVASDLDSVIDYYVTITFTDGTTATTEMEILQDVSGRVFLVPYRTGSSVNEVLDDHPIRSIRFDSIRGDNYVRAAQPEQQAFVTCFTAGTMIETAKGPKPVEMLRPGDLVDTLDDGLQPLRWIGATRAQAMGALVPVRIEAGALGHGRPTRPLCVSQQHRIFVKSRIARRMFGHEEMLIAAKKLVGLPGIALDARVGHIHYWHVMFDRHQIVTANGALAESLYFAAQCTQLMPAEAIEEILHLFPQLASAAQSSARPFIEGKGRRQFSARHAKTGHALFEVTTTICVG